MRRYDESDLVIAFLAGCVLAAITIVGMLHLTGGV